VLQNFHNKKILQSQLMKRDSLLMADTDWKLGKKVFLLKDEDVHCWFSVMAFKKTQEKAYVVPFRQALQMLSTIYLQILFFIVFSVLRVCQRIMKSSFHRLFLTRLPQRVFSTSFIRTLPGCRKTPSRIHFYPQKG